MHLEFGIPINVVLQGCSRLIDQSFGGICVVLVTGIGRVPGSGSDHWNFLGYESRSDETRFLNANQGAGESDAVED
uniref:Uncharacterized protein n=1 Tax=Romanomermis culicivorax TaxID=13658 RepID=A0A915KJ43_ROMCU